MSHELRTPLNAVVGLAQLLEPDQRDALSDTHRRGLDYIQGAAQHLVAMIDEALDLSRIEADHGSIRPEAVELVQAWDDALRLASPVDGRHPTLAHVPCGALSADAMPQQIARTLQAGFDDHLTIPINLQRLVDVMLHWLRRRAGG